MSSQRHKMIVRNYGATCYAIDEKQPAAGYLRQIPGPFVQPFGPAGGPLQGSSLAGPPPAAIPNPQLDHPLLLLGLIATGGAGPWEPPAALEGGERSLGPFVIVRVVPDGDGGVWYVLDNVDIRAGDTLRVEATGNSATNGDFVVENVNQTDTPGEIAIYRSDPTLSAEITGKGRVTIIPGD